MEKILMSKITTNGKAVFVAYDAGLEHGPVDFNLININPEFVIKTASDAGINGIILQHGIAEKYFNPKIHKIPLIIKLNGKTRLRQGDPYSTQICSIDRAVRLGADAVGYTIYPGSEFSPMMYQQLAYIVEKAHKLGLPVIAWVYPRGHGIDETSTENIAYAARIALEMGADIAKIKYNGDFEGFKWACKAAGKTKIVMVGGPRHDDISFLNHLYEAVNAGAIGTAVGRNVWQHPHPSKMLEAIKDIVYYNKKPEEALKRLK